MAKAKTLSRSKGNVPAVITDEKPNTGELLVAGGKNFRVKKIVTLPLLKHLDGMVVMIRITSKIYVGKEIKNEKGSASGNNKPADLVDIIELNTNRQMVYIVSAVCKSNLETTYPDHSYVNKSFAIRKGAKVEGKRYRAYEILEIDADPEAEAA